MTGHFSHRLQERLLDAESFGDPDGGPAGALVTPARQIISTGTIDSIYLVERIVLYPDCMGYKLTGRILVTRMELLQRDPGQTAVVLEPYLLVPLTPEHYPDSEERVSAMTKVTQAFFASGLKPWQNSRAWWLSPKRSAEIAMGMHSHW